MNMTECYLLVESPHELTKMYPALGDRPVNCRGNILYTDGSKSGFYFYMERYPDGDAAVWGTDIRYWGW